MNMKKTSTLLILLVLLTSMPQLAKASDQPFSDVPEDHWAYQAVIGGLMDGLWQGYNDGSFGLNKEITREEFAVIIDRDEHLILEQSGHAETINQSSNDLILFKDVPQDHWAFDAISNGKDNNLWQGYPDGRFGLGKDITREEVAVLLKKDNEAVADKLGLELQFENNPTATTPFSDVAKEHWAYQAIEEGRLNGLWQGKSDGTFGLGKDITREEVAALFERHNTILKELINNQVTKINGGNQRIAFLTSAVTNGNFGGLAGADTICQGLADKAGLKGNYMAWVSTEDESPSSRFEKFDGNYINTRGKVIATNWNDLTDGTLQGQIKYDEKGNEITTDVGMELKKVSRSARWIVAVSAKTINKLVSLSLIGWDLTHPENYAWTGTDSSGVSTNVHNCLNWTDEGEAPLPAGSTADLGSSTMVLYGLGGNYASMSGSWSNDSPAISTCVDYHRLYCFQQDEAKAEEEKSTATGQTASRTFFVTSETYDGNLDGIEGADDLCQLSAMKGKLTANGRQFQAVLANGIHGAMDRFEDVIDLQNAGGLGYMDYLNTNGDQIANAPWELIDKAYNSEQFYDESGKPLNITPFDIWGGDGSDVYQGLNDNQCKKWTSNNTIDCSDGADNDGDGNVDSEDSGCWTNDLDPSSYDPNRNETGMNGTTTFGHVAFGAQTKMVSCEKKLRLACLENVAANMREK